MKLLRREKKNSICNATYEKVCPCCGKKFRARYPMNDMYLAQSAKDVVKSHYNAHTLFCNPVSVKMDCSA